MEIKNKGFTLIEVLAVIVIIAIIAAIAVPAVKNILTESKRDTFGLSAQKVLDGALQQEALNDEFEATEVSVQNLKAKLKMSNANYQELIITETDDKELYIYIEGKNKWKNLVVCGTHDDIIVESKGNIEVCVVPTGNTWACGKAFTDLRSDGYDNEELKAYETITIGDQCWMAEDLRWKCSNYSDASVLDGWSSATDMCAPSGSANGVDYSDTILYQWEVAKDEACPSGWHLPTDGEWQQLEIELGMNVGEASDMGLRGESEKVGDQLKGNVKKEWCYSNEGECYGSGFNANPIGYRTDGSGTLNTVGSYGLWWTATEDDFMAWRRGLNDSYSGVDSYLYSQLTGCAVRCVKD